jgi:hypothetical protein
LRFNDGSLARVGERATFRFIPNTRNFRLSNGTMLLLIPPGRGRTTIQTPTAVTGIQGSAVVVRHVDSRDLTIIMALTNNPAGPMTVTLADCDPGANCTSEYHLEAGNMAVIQGGEIEVLEFDLHQFYETSPLINDLDLDNPESEVNLDEGLSQVREEMEQALTAAEPMDEAQSTVLNPSMISIISTEESVAGQPWLIRPETGSSSLTVDRASGLLPAGVLVETASSNTADTGSPGSGAVTSGGSGIDPGNDGGGTIGGGGIDPGNNGGGTIGGGGIDPGNNGGGAVGGDTGSNGGNPSVPAEPPPFTGEFPDKVDLPDDALENLEGGPGQANPPPFQNQ